MKTVFCIAFLLMGTIVTLVAQKIDFSAYLAPVGGVHSSTPSVTDKNGNIFVAGGTRVPIIGPDCQFTMITCTFSEKPCRTIFR
ncbi:MAG: hypothetical protein EOM90_16440 [Alphaproteobacteria bacterium]|nr:hypothetical protein [Alphaproteobacteria bacterium]